MVASRLLRAVAALVILLPFAAGLRKSYWSGCMKAATVICQQIFFILALVNFLLKILLTSASKSSFFRSGVEIRFWSYNFRRRCAYFYCVLQLSLCRSHCNGCVKVASCCGCIGNTIVFCSWISEIVLEWLHEGCEMDLLADFLHFGTSVFLLHVGLEQWEVWGVKSAV